jgi:hypothetical protein
MHVSIIAAARSHCRGVTLRLPQTHLRLPQTMSTTAAACMKIAAAKSKIAAAILENCRCNHLLVFGCRRLPQTAAAKKFILHF